MHQVTDKLDEQDSKKWEVFIPYEMLAYLVRHPLGYSWEEMSQLTGFNERTIEDQARKAGLTKELTMRTHRGKYFKNN